MPAFHRRLLCSSPWHYFNKFRRPPFLLMRWLGFLRPAVTLLTRAFFRCYYQMAVHAVGFRTF